MCRSASQSEIAATTRDIATKRERIAGVARAPNSTHGAASLRGAQFKRM
jgi:hypothetical protein